MEEKEDTIVYEFEDCDNGSILHEPIHTGQKAIALYGNTKENRYINVQILLGKWLHEDMQSYMNQLLTSKIRLTIKFEKIDD